MGGALGPPWPGAEPLPVGQRAVCYHALDISEAKGSGDLELRSMSSPTWHLHHDDGPSRVAQGTVPWLT